MNVVKYEHLVSPELLKGAIENNEFPGFREDYHVLHCLLRLYNPKSVFEVGTNLGTGTRIICNAVPSAQVYSLDLPTELAHISLQHPISEGKGDKVGSNCNLPFTQLRGDSMKFDFSQYPCEAYFIDGEHDFEHVKHELLQICPLAPEIIIFHDADIEGIKDAIIDTLLDSGGEYSGQFDIFFVEGTRIAFATLVADTSNPFA